ncbi:hypothetical protein Scep_001649 [Stephania cephalantha]|uniref:Uncharacterized protein n=1 Tax=Stephania cephalantha TaxID=152367 RepID=A0AAP0L9R5_9MAGN
MSAEAFPHLRILLSNGSLIPYKALGAAVGVEVMNVSRCMVEAMKEDCDVCVGCLMEY